MCAKLPTLSPQPIGRLRRALLVAGLLAAASCQHPVALHTLRGKAMGTAYTIKFARAGATDAGGVHAAITAELRRFDKVFSTYDPSSEISRFNRHQSLAPFPGSAEFIELVERALQIAERTEGAFDPTVAPVLRLYGFGPGAQKPAALPSDAELERARVHTGWSKLKVDSGRLVKQHPRLELDLNALAKGAGVDRVAGVLDQLGVRSYMVEIGGEVRCRGRKPDGSAWVLGVADPKHPGEPEIVDRVEVLDQAMATSGDYLQFRDIAGVRVPHIVDPRTGRAPRHHVVSATVLAPNCELADALATALMVLDPAHGQRVLEGYGSAVHALVLVSDGKQFTRHLYRWGVR